MASTENIPGGFNPSGERQDALIQPNDLAGTRADGSGRLRFVYVVTSLILFYGIFGTLVWGAYSDLDFLPNHAPSAMAPTRPSGAKEAQWSSARRAQEAWRTWTLRRAQIQTRLLAASRDQAARTEQAASSSEPAASRGGPAATSSGNVELINAAHRRPAIAATKAPARVARLSMAVHKPALKPIRTLARPVRHASVMQEHASGPIPLFRSTPWSPVGGRDDNDRPSEAAGSTRAEPSGRAPSGHNSINKEDQSDRALSDVFGTASVEHRTSVDRGNQAAKRDEGRSRGKDKGKDKSKGRDKGKDKNKDRSERGDKGGRGKGRR